MFNNVLPKTVCNCLTQYSFYLLILQSGVKHIFVVEHVLTEIN